MAKQNAIRSGRAFVELSAESSQLVKDLRAAESRVEKFAKNITMVGANLTAVSAAVLAPLGASVLVASTMEETLNKFNVVFGRNADAAKAWGDQFAAQVGRSKRQIAEFLAGNQDLFIPLGFDEGAATDMSKQVTGLALDLASFNNLADGDAMRDLQAALTGSGEVMKKYGVIVSEAAVQQELLNQGLDPTAVTEAQKVQARLNIIMRGTTAAQGDAIRSAGGFANSQKGLRGTIEDTAGKIGKALLPAATDLVNRARRIVAVAGAWAERNQHVVRTVATLAAGVGALGVVLLAIGGTGLIVAKSIATLAAIVTTLTTATKAAAIAATFLAAHPVGAIILGIVAAYSALYYTLGRATDATKELTHAMTEQRRKGDDLRAADMDRMKRLDQLATKESLNADEMREARGLIDQLKQRYGELGITLDETTGKIHGMADGWKHHNAASRDAALFDVNNQIREERANMEKLAQQLEDKRVSRQRWGVGLGGNSQEDFDAIADAITRKGRELHQLMLQKREIENGAAASSAAPADTASAVQARQAAELEAQWADKLHQLKMQQIEDEHEREATLIMDRYAKEMAAAKAAGATHETLQTIDTARDLELRALGLRELERLDDEARRAREQDAHRHERDMDQTFRVAGLILRTKYEGYELERRMLDLEKKRAMREAEAAGLRTDLVEREYALRQRLLEMQEQSRGLSGQIIFNRGAVGGATAEETLQGGIAGVNREDPLSRLVQLAGDIRRTVVRIDNKTENGGPTFAGA